MAIGIFLTFRILDIADMTAEGAFPLGAAVVASQIQAGQNPWLATLFSIFGDASRFGLWSSSYQDEDPSALNRDCDTDWPLFDQY